MVLEDIDRIREIDVASFTLPWPERSFRFEIVENEASRLWVAEVQEGIKPPVIVAMIVLWLIVDEAHIGTFAVHPDFRRKGIGQKLLAAALIEAEKAGIKTCFLEVRRSNTAAQELYEKFGFQVVSVRNHYYRDNNEDALLMTLHPVDPLYLHELLDQDSQLYILVPGSGQYG